MKKKVVNDLQPKNVLKKLAEKTGGIFRTADLTALGISPYDIRKLISDQIIERIKSGYYCLHEAQESMPEAMLIRQLFPDGVLCMYTALFHYGYSNRTPLEWGIAVDKNTSKARFKMDYPYIHPYYIKPELLTFGVTEADYKECKLKIFDRDRLICECVFFEKKMDRETYVKAIQSYTADPKKNISNLLEYAEKRRILKRVKERIGVWL